MTEAAERLRQARDAEARIKAFTETHDVCFNGAGEEGLPNVEQSWSVDHLDASQRKANRMTLRGIAAILKDYKMIRCEVHGETGAAHSAPKPLARHLGLHPEFDVKSCMNALARARAQACVDALISMGVPPRQLFLTFDGMGGRIAVDFRPEGKLPTEPEAVALDSQPHPCEDDCEHLQGWLSRRTTLRQWGPAHLPPRHGPCVRSAPLPWAKRDLAHALRKFPRLESSDALREWLRAVSKKADGGADFEAYVRVLCEAPPPSACGQGAEARAEAHADPIAEWVARLPGVIPADGEWAAPAAVASSPPDATSSGGGGGGGSKAPPAPALPYDGAAPHTLADLLHFDCARLSKLGVCTPKRAKDLSTELTALRRVVTSEETLSGNERFPGPLMPGWLFRILGHRGGDVERPTPISWPEVSEDDPRALREARSRIQELLEDHSIAFNGAGEDGLPHISQAWSVEHLDPATHQANMETLDGIAEILREFSHLRCARVHVSRLPSVVLSTSRSRLPLCACGRAPATRLPPRLSCSTARPSDAQSSDARSSDAGEVHGETGLVRSAPVELAAFLGLDADRPSDVKQAMDSLAMLRAQAW
jgi:hypothetical protein